MSDSILRDFVSGGVGGVFTVVVGHPFDTIKVRLQTAHSEGKLKYSGTLDCVRKTWHREGIRGFYAGMLSPLIGVSPLLATFFAGASLGGYLQRKSPDQELTFIQNANSGALAGFLTSFFMSPGERVKCVLQIQRQNGRLPRYNGPTDVVRQLYRTGGIRSIYRGWPATLLRDIPASAAYISVYDYLKKLFAGNHPKNELSPIAVLFAGGLAGMANWLVCIPTDMMKSKLQTAPDGKYPNGIRDVFKEVIRIEGPIGLFRGFTPVMLRAFPANAACFLGIELTLLSFHWYDKSQSPF
ncbi:CBN-DIF-1 protein [Aphelenchoides besseyi]|nr:CBN-DIF-1 protein [Aphelenchoides besseyi]KAI6195209.1 CBN-DIF-1 protein [Aphelenchoides besseyi]